MINLGKKTFWWRVRVVLYSPIWFFYESLTKKSWEEFKHGLITHKCEFDRSTYEALDENLRLYSCKHFGCNMADIEDDLAIALNQRNENALAELKRKIADFKK